MSKTVIYVHNSIKSVVSDKVAVILEKKGQVRIIGDAKKKEEPAKAGEKKADEK